jgi:hypothetical protein
MSQRVVPRMHGAHDGMSRAQDDYVHTRCNDCMPVTEARQSTAHTDCKKSHAKRALWISVTHIACSSGTPATGFMAMSAMVAPRQRCAERQDCSCDRAHTRRVARSALFDMKRCNFWLPTIVFTKVAKFYETEVPTFRCGRSGRRVTTLQQGELCEFSCVPHNQFALHATHCALRSHICLVSSQTDTRQHTHT